MNGLRQGRGRGGRAEGRGAEGVTGAARKGYQKSAAWEFEDERGRNEGGKDKIRDVRPLQDVKKGQQNRCNATHS